MNSYTSLLRAVLYGALLSTASGQTAQTITSITPVSIGGSDKRYDVAWPGTAGRTYFIQVSLTMQANSWTFVPQVLLGAGGTITQPVIVSAPQPAKYFIRLKYTDVYPPSGDARYADFDGDGIPNLVEVTGTGSGAGTGTGTDPFTANTLPDTDADGIVDAVEIYFYGNLTAMNATGDTDADGYSNFDELAQGSSPASAAIKPFDPTNPPAPNRFVAPSSWWIENKFNDTFERLNIPVNGQPNPELAVKIARANSLADGSYDLPYTSIQAAVNAANNGDVIQVAPGTYTETVDLRAKGVRLIAQRGSREETIIQPPGSATQGLLLGSLNKGGTIISGFTIRNSPGPAVKCETGAAPVLHNLYLDNNQKGVEAASASPLLLNLVCANSFGAASTDAALYVTGAGSKIRASHCTIADNVVLNTTAGQIQIAGSGNTLTLQNSIVSSAADRPGGQITLTGGATAAVTHSSVRGGYTGTGNLAAGDAANPQYDTRAVVGGQRRLLLTSPCADRASGNGLPGHSYFTLLDADGEARRRGYSLPVRVSGADIGADEFVSRLTFPTINRLERGQVRTYSEVDEASDVAFLGQLTNGNARIAIINDETIENTAGVQFNQITFYEVDRTSGSLLASSALPINRNGQFGGMEIKDPEGLAYNPAAGILYLTTSQTRVNHYRDCEPTTYDPLVDPPSNDYDPRRCIMLSVPIGAANSATPLLPSGAATYYDARDGEWQPVAANRRTMDDFANGGSAVSPVGFDSPNGLIAQLQQQLQGNAALQASVKNTGVLIAISTSPKFGSPVNGTAYQPGASLPYGSTSGLGGPSATAGWVLHLPANPNTADYPYYTLATLPAGGQQVTSFRTSPGGTLNNLQPNTTYYFKTWAYDAQRNYGRGLEAEATTSTLPPVKINEFNANGDWIELFNASGAQTAVGGFFIMDDNGRTTTIPAGTNIPARSYLNYVPTWGLSNGSDNVRLFLADGTTTVDHFEQYTRNQLAGNTEGRVWDGGPRGKAFDFDQTAGGQPAPRFESEGSLFRTGGTSTHPVSQTAANHTEVQASAKIFQASQNHITQTGIYLHYTNLGAEPAVWRYSPKQQDFHPISAEGLAVRSNNEIVVGLRSPLVNRTTGHAYAFVFSNAGNQFLPAAGWAAPAAGLQSVRQINLNGQGIRSIQWCPQLNAGAGAYLIIGGAANGGPLKNETSRQVFSLYRWDNVNGQPVQIVADLAPFAVRPEGVNIITLNGTPRVIFVEDRFKAEGYDTQNAVHWPLADLNL